MRKYFQSNILLLFILALLYVGFSNSACKVKSCEVKIDNGVVTCDATNCPSPRKCVLQKRKKNTENPWKDTSEPEDEDKEFEYRCLCRK